MESPEDDAGIATSASRRESAREKDVGQTEEVDATSSYDQDSTEARTSCQTPAMSEDNFDGDSVPSPSTQDVNTSTEAILDMIDEIVDGPGAPKRLPLVCESVYVQNDQSSSASKSPPQESSKNIGENSPPTPQIAVSDASDSSKQPCPSIMEDPECSSLAEKSEIVYDSTDKTNHVSESVSECINNVQKLQSIPHCSDSSVETGTSTNYPDIQSNSALQTLQNISESSDCEQSERTVKSVTSSETRDCVTVEKAESTSSDCSVSEGQVLILEKSTKSPLRKRLVRPLPNDRRPDSTVSSTVDSQSVNICTTVQISENITKDVSSSSDAMPAVHGNIRSDEIRNVSDFSICKAETSVSSPKKIKLIRPKFMIPEGDNDRINDNQVLTSEQQHCQPTSTDVLSTHITNRSVESSSNIISTSDSFVAQVKLPMQVECSEEHLTEQVSVETNKEVVNTNLSIPNTSSIAETLNDNSKSNVAQESNLMGLSLESSLVTETSNIKQVTSDQCAKDEVKEPLMTSKLTDSGLNVNNSDFNNDNINKTDLLLLNVELKDQEVKIDPCISSSTIITCDKNMIIEDNRVEVLIDPKENEKKIPPIKLNLSNLLEPSTSSLVSTEELSKKECDTIKQVPKLTIKLSSMQPEEVKSPTPKITIKPLKPPIDDERNNKIDNSQQIPCVAKLNIKPVLKSPEIHDEIPTKLHTDIDNTNAVIEQMPCVIKLNIKPIQKPQEDLSDISNIYHIEDEGNSKSHINEHIPSITKLNIKPILKPPEKINDIHRKSSSSEISESECSENDETTSTSDQASVSDQGSTDIVPKVTIKLGKPGTESEGKFYTEQNIPKLTIKGIQSTENEDLESTSKLKLVISQQDNKQLEKIPKLTIKTLTKSESQPLSPKLTIKPIKPPESNVKETDVSKTKLYAESVCGSSEIKENIHVPKITIKSITKTDADPGPKTPKKLTVISDSADHIPFVTKLNIKPILKPMENEETSGEIDDKVPVVSKLNIKPIIRPKDNEIDFSLEDVPKITKLNIKPIKCPEVNTSEQKDCDGLKTDIDKSSIPVITKINIKPIVKPEEEVSKYSENQSSETSSSSDDNADHIPVITKLNIKPISKPTDEGLRQNLSHEQTIPNITKLNIKPIIKPDDISSPSSPKKDHLKNVDLRSSCIPVVTKLNIKPIVKPEEPEIKKSGDQFEENPMKNPPLLMKINIKSVAETINRDNLLQDDHKYNNLSEYTHDDKHSNIDKPSQYAQLSNTVVESVTQSDSQDTITFSISDSTIKQNCISGDLEHHNTDKMTIVEIETSITEEDKTNITLANKIIHDKLEKTEVSQICEKNDESSSQKKDTCKGQNIDLVEIQTTNKPKVALQNCTLLKKLLENTKEHLSKKVEESRINLSNCLLNQENVIMNKDMNCTTLFDSRESGDLSSKKVNLEKPRESEDLEISSTDIMNDMCSVTKPQIIHNICEVTNSDNLSKPLEINISEKLSNQSSGLDSPRIILKINKTDHGSSAKIITEEIKRPGTPQQNFSENTQENLNDSENSRKHNVNSRRKVNSEDSISISVGKRLRSSRIVENVEKSPQVRRNMGKRPSTTETSPNQNKETELSILETKRLKLGQLLSVNKSLTLSPVVTRITQTSPTKTNVEYKHGVKPVNHSILNNENCSKNGNSKLHNILSNLQAKQKQSLPFQDINHVEVTPITTEDKTHSSLSDSNMSEIVPKENCHTKVQEMLINENSDFREFGTTPDEVSQDPLEVDTTKEVPIVLNETVVVPQHVAMTPQPKKRGRPRKIPLTDSPKPVTIILPVPALEERPQRSLRLTRDRPTILRKPRGRGRGRGARGAANLLAKSLLNISATQIESDDQMITPIDPTCSRIKLPRMTEALDNMPGGCSTPLSSRRRSSSNMYLDRELKEDGDSSKLDDVFLKSPEVVVRGRGRGSRGGRGRTPRGRGRGRGGGRGAVYMKETMGIYGRVCGPATTTVQLFEEETCMMDDNATPAKPSHLMDEDSQGSVKSSTNDSNKLKKSKFSDLFDSNKIWTAADVKEYTWPTQETPDAVPQIMMIQEQVAMFLGVKSFKRRYPELKRRPIVGEEKNYVLGKGLVTEALCDLGITAVEASEVLDIMLSDYPHKYEEYRSHQRERQLTEPVEEPKVEIKAEEKMLKVEVKAEKCVDVKPDVPKIDPEKVRQDTAAAAIASASEWNARVNAMRRAACVDLQTLTVHRRRAPPPAAPRTHVRPPAGFYPHALLPGQYQHAYRVYTPEQLRYFPLNTVLAAPAAPPSPADSSSDSEPDWGSRSSSSDNSDSHIHASKRKKLSKVKRSSQAESKEKEEVSTETSSEDTCRTCKLRLEGNRKYTHERFLVCASCNAKLHPSCVELSADTIRKCREYAWQCAECKTCCACRLPADDDKMLFCDLCDRGFHIYCVGLATVPTGRWHCVECSICKSCGARDPAGLGASSASGTTPCATPGATPHATPGTTHGTTPGTSTEGAEWHHQTRRGPGGHKVYSHSLCTPCARAYRIGRYCPLCDRSFIGPKGTMQLVICKLCDRQLHQECVRQTVSSLKVLDYTCAECRRGGITSRAAAVRLAPRTIATLFMAKRRFNKYAHRQYMLSRMASTETSDPADACDPTDASDPADQSLDGAG